MSEERQSPSVSGPSPVAASDAVFEAARALERADSLMAERIAMDRVRSAINVYDATVAKWAKALGGKR